MSEVKIKDDLVFNDGSPISAKHFVANALLFSHNSLIALGIGGGPLLALQQMAIDVYRGVEGTVAENIAAYLAGKLRKVSEMTCTGGHVGQ